MERTPPTHNEVSDNDALYDTELDRVKQKLQRAYMRRDHYAQLYYRAMAELDETKWELSVAKNKIQELKSLVGKMQSSMNGKDLSHWRHANLGSPPHEHNGQTTPDSGAISMSPGPENNEGHERQVDEEGDEKTLSAAHSENGYYQSRVTRTNSKPGLNEGSLPQGDWRAGRQPSMPPIKRVGFCDSLPPPIPPRQLTNRAQYDMAAPHGYHTGFQRAYTLSESEMSQLTQPSMPAYMSQNRMHRSHSVAHNGGQMQQPNGATFPRTQYSGSHMHQPVLAGSASAFSLSSDHRLPRVHRGVHGYENIIVPPPNYPMHHPALVHGSAFMKVGNGRGIDQAAMSMDPLYMMQQMQQQQQQQQQIHHQQQQYQQAGTVVPSSPSTTGPPPDERKKSVRIRTGNPPSQNSDNRKSLGERRSFSRLTDSELRDLFYQISSPKCSLHGLEISHSGMGKAEVMNTFCQELRKNTSLHELSLPNNGIDRQSLGQLLDMVTCCRNIKELMLRNNDIGNDCAEMIQNFLNKTHLESIVLTGNPIEHHTHLLNAPLPQEFYTEYGNAEVISGEKAKLRNEGSLHDELKMMHI